MALIFDREALRAPAQSPCSLRIYLLLALIYYSTGTNDLTALVHHPPAPFPPGEILNLIQSRVVNTQRLVPCT